MNIHNLKATIVIAFSISFVCTSCNKKSDENLPTEPVPINLTNDQVSLIGAENSFAFDIFNLVLKNSGENQNIIISPLSISFALSMTLNGANGATRDSMLAALRVNGITPEIINNSYKDLSAALLNIDKRIIISIANSVWTEKNFVVKIPFKNVLEEYYNAESKSFDITDPLVPEQINTWIENKTNGLIKNMVDHLDDRTLMLLINAIYFKGKWQSQFDPRNTVEGTFYKPGDSTSEIPLMKISSEFKIFTNEKFSVAEFPYGQGNFVMDVILPSERNGLNSILPLINNSMFDGWVNSMISRLADVSFPRFKYGYKIQLKDILSQMGMSIAFTDNADFSYISDIPLLIKDVTHQALIETNEEGSEAAAATIVEIINTSIPVPVVFNMDHPFLYIIRETKTNTILFMGKIADPLTN